MFANFRSLGHLLVLAALCLLVIPQGRASTDARGAAPRSVKVQAKMTSISVSFNTVVPTKAVLSLSYGSATGLQLYSGMRKRHVFRLIGLQPGASYRCSLATLTLKRQTAKKSVPCATKALGPAPADIRGERFYLDGAPTFLLMASAYSWCPDSKIVEDNQRVGIFVMEHDRPGCGGALPSADQLHGVLQNKMLWYERQSDGAMQVEGLPELVDFPPNINQNTKTFLVTCSASSAEPLFDLIRGKEKPVVNIIPVATHMTPSIPNCIDAQRLNVLFWTAAAAGATGASYVTQLPWNDSAGVRVKPDLVPAMVQLSREIAVFGPALLGGRRITVTSSEKSVKVAGFVYGGATYVIASNTASKATPAIFVVDKGGNRIATPIGRRGIKLTSGRFSDQFEGFDVNIYRIPPVSNG